jgi:hypothetical protein
MAASSSFDILKELDLPDAHGSIPWMTLYNADHIKAPASGGGGGGADSKHGPRTLVHCGQQYSAVCPFIGSRIGELHTQSFHILFHADAHNHAFDAATTIHCDNTIGDGNARTAEDVAQLASKCGPDLWTEQDLKHSLPIEGFPPGSNSVEVRQLHSLNAGTLSRHCVWFQADSDRESKLPSLHLIALFKFKTAIRDKKRGLVVHHDRVLVCSSSFMQMKVQEALMIQSAVCYYYQPPGGPKPTPLQPRQLVYTSDTEDPATKLLNSCKTTTETAMCALYKSPIGALLVTHLMGLVLQSPSDSLSVFGTSADDGGGDGDDMWDDAMPLLAPAHAVETRNEYVFYAPNQMQLRLDWAVVGGELPQHVRGLPSSALNLYIHFGPQQNGVRKLGTGPDWCPIRDELVHVSWKCSASMANMIKSRNRHICAYDYTTYAPLIGLFVRSCIGNSVDLACLVPVIGSLKRAMLNIEVGDKDPKTIAKRRTLAVVLRSVFSSISSVSPASGLAFGQHICVSLRGLCFTDGELDKLIDSIKRAAVMAKKVTDAKVEEEDKKLQQSADLVVKKGLTTGEAVARVFFANPVSVPVPPSAAATADVASAAASSVSASVNGPPGPSVDSTHADVMEITYDLIEQEFNTESVRRNNEAPSHCAPMAVDIPLSATTKTTGRKRKPQAPPIDEEPQPAKTPRLDAAAAAASTDAKRSDKEEKGAVALGSAASAPASAAPAICSEPAVVAAAAAAAVAAKYNESTGQLLLWAQRHTAVMDARLRRIESNIEAHAQYMIGLSERVSVLEHLRSTMPVVDPTDDSPSSFIL